MAQGNCHCSNQALEGDRRGWDVRAEGISIRWDWRKVKTSRAFKVGKSGMKKQKVGAWSFTEN